MIRRPPRSTLSSSSAASDVYKRQYQRRVRGGFTCWAMSRLGNVVALLVFFLESVHGNELVITAKYFSEAAPRFLSLRGDGLGLSWDQGLRMTQQPPGTFTAVLPLSGQTDKLVSFKTLFDDEIWQLGANSQVQVSPGNVTVYPWFKQASGQYWVAEHDVPSKHFQNTRDVVLYVPPSYLENVHPDARFETLVMCDGENVFNDSTSFGGVSWGAQATIDANILSGNMREIAVVAVYNTAERMDEYTPVKDPQYKGGHADAYLDWVSVELLPLMAPKYRLAVDRANLGLLGSSLGGLLACYAGWTRTVYGRVGCMSSSFWWNNNWTDNTLLATHSPPPSDTVFYVDSGDQPAPDGDDEEETQAVRDHMAELGWTLGENLFYYLQHGGEHNEQSWGSRFEQPMTALYPTKVNVPH
eukprot:TRINITY_DN6399_c0_g1_i5.p1 TRINITY_DN6399_c0_g1~~TRINITY_DN6399_c0_g1_i5.p1  ORF type:complete len:413 (+),score=87.00 TRINITY_DN6399_c0_g1_i5:97-1335(+)